MHGLVLFRNRSRKWGLSASASPEAVAHGARTTQHTYAHWAFRILALSAARIREALRKGRKRAIFLFRLAMGKRPIFGVVCYQRYRAVLRMAVVAVLVGFLGVSGAMAQESPDEGAAVAAEVEPDEGPTKVAGDALADYLRALVESQAARANAETARANAIQAQATLSEAVRAATDARTVLAAVVSRLAADSGAVEGSALGLGGEWRAPALPGATAGP